MSEKWDAPAFDTVDRVEAVAIAAVSYAMWRDWNREIEVSQPGRPSWLQHLAGSQYLQKPGYPPEPTASFNGELMPIGRLAAFGLEINRPLSPLMKCVWTRLVSRDGEDDPVSVADMAETLVEMINLESEERHGSMAA